MFRIVALLTVLGVAAGCGGDGNDRTARPTTTRATTTTTTPVTSGAVTTGPTTTVPPATTTPSRLAPVRVYFARDELVATAGRAVVPPAVARGALEALLQGPDDFERGIGMGTQIPPGTKLLGIVIRDGTAIVDFDSRFESGGGTLSMTVRIAQVVFTLTQFDTVERVTITLDGRPVVTIGGEGLTARDLTRADFESATPFILVESPVPGATVTSPFTVSGISNTFEATVNYDLTGSDGSVIGGGFTTATAGNGTWGSFEFTATSTVAQPGSGAVVTFQISPEDGSRRNVYEVPVRIT